MGMFDFFRFDKDFSFLNNKGDIVVIPKDEYQTKAFNNVLAKLEINENNEILEPVVEWTENEEYDKYDPRRWSSHIKEYRIINFTGEALIYSENKTFDLFIINGEIVKIEELNKEK